jgi:hypothetical protein
MIEHKFHITYNTIPVEVSVEVSYEMSDEVSDEVSLAYNEFLFSIGNF